MAPNAVPLRRYGLVYQSVSTLKLNLTANPGGALPFILRPTLTKTALLYSSTSLIYGTGAGLGVGPGAPAQNKPDKFYFTGRSDNFGPGGSSVGFRQDPIQQTKPFAS